jgi:hypothetical protein
MTKLQYRVYERLQQSLEDQAANVWQRYVKVAEQVFGKDQRKAYRYAYFRHIDTMHPFSGRERAVFRYEEDEPFYIPLDWLFDPEFEVKARAIFEAEIAEDKAKQEAREKASLLREWEQFERLKEKFQKT